jgi:oligopeptide/dipeptide ABC transporter ATP-binding protein
MTATLLHVRDLTVDLPIEDRYARIIDGIELEIARGETVGLVGESGSGKSMTARAITRLLPDKARVTGHVMLDGKDVLSLGIKELRAVRARKVATIFQDARSHINPLFTCGDFIIEGLTVINGLDRHRARVRAQELLVEVGITDPARVLRAYPHELSGGMLQRIAIAGALAASPELIIADEPTTALDVTIQAEIMAIFADLRRRSHVSMLFISHDLELAAAICNRVFVMYAGQIVAVQGGSRLFAEPVHPYAAGLLAARPEMGVRAARLKVIPGQPVDPLNRPAGCPFYPRCSFGQDRCTRERPQLESVGGGLSACVRAREIQGQLRPETTARRVC